MAQSYYAIQQALDAQFLNTNSGIGLTQWSPTNKTGTFFGENQTFSLDYFPSITGKIFARSTLVPMGPQTSTIGIGGYDKISGVYAIDVMGQLDKGYTATKQAADRVIAAFPRGLQLTLTTGDQITVETTGIAPIQLGAWAMNKLYCVQVQVKWFGYMTP